MTNAIAAYGVQFQVGDGAAPENFTTVAEVVDVEGPGLKSDTKDVSSHSSPNAVKEKIVTLIDAGEITLSLNYVPGDPTQNAATGLIALQMSRTKRNVKIIWPDSAHTTWTCPCYVTDTKPAGKVDDKLALSATLTLAGFPTLA